MLNILNPLQLFDEMDIIRVITKKEYAEGTRNGVGYSPSKSMDERASQKISWLKRQVPKSLRWGNKAGPTGIWKHDELHGQGLIKNFNCPAEASG